MASHAYIQLYFITSQKHYVYTYNKTLELYEVFIDKI